MSNVNETYWYDLWHLDKNLHNLMKIKNVEKIPNDKSVSVYGDSISGDSIIKTNIGDMSIEDLYNLCIKSDRVDKDVATCHLSSSNWTDEEICMSKIKNVIRHRVSKKKWKIIAGGNELLLTNDHSLIIFRNNSKMEIKPSEVRKGDKVLVVNEE